ncbi:hypothetical protein KY289_033776 [Solanum tuberosum]|nr:hypothetical protein KY289_033776 [Solanum tuberosum]
MKGATLEEASAFKLKKLGTCSMLGMAGRRGSFGTRGCYEDEACMRHGEEALVGAIVYKHGSQT